MLKNCFDKLQEIAKQPSEYDGGNTVNVKVNGDGEGSVYFMNVFGKETLLFCFWSLEDFTAKLAQYKCEETVKI